MVSSVFFNDNYYLLEYYNKEFDGEKTKGCFVVDIRCEYHAFHWRLLNSTHATSVLRSFTIKEYLEKTEAVVDKLFEVWSKNEPVAYKKFDVDLEAIELCKKQMIIAAVKPSNYILTNDLVQEERFYFNIVNDNNYGNYCIGIGDRQYRTWLTDWDNDLESKRHQLETYIYEREATLKLSFDTSETIVVIKHKSVLDQIEKKGEGRGYKYKDYVLVEVRPNDFEHKPILKGYCDEKETIRTLYEGLLRHTMQYPNELKRPYDDVTKIVAYNKIKSPLIESFLRGDTKSENSYSLRQVNVKHILTIDPDVMKLFHDEEQISYDSFENLYDKHGQPIKLDDFLKWQKEIEPIVINSATGKEYEKDWDDYHKRGMALAKQLREKLSTDFDFWYTAPREDKSGTVPKLQLII